MRAFFISVLIIASVKLSSCAQQKAEGKENPASSETIRNVYIPKTLTFAGEQVPLDSIDVFERLEKELIVNQYKHSSSLMIIKRAPRFKEKILKILNEEGVPADFLYLAAIESEFDAYANSGYAAGFWQFTPSSAEEANLEISEFVEQRYDLTASTFAACKFLKKAKQRLGTWTMAAAAFNRGIKAMDSIGKQQGASSYYSLYLNPETSRYVFRILAIKLILENPGKYGYDVKEDEKYKPLPSKLVRIDHTIDDLNAYCADAGINFKILKYYNPWINYSATTDHPDDLKLEKSKRRKVYKKAYRFEVPAGKIYYFELPSSAKVKDEVK